LVTIQVDKPFPHLLEAVDLLAHQDREVVLAVPHIHLTTLSASMATSRPKAPHMSVAVYVPPMDIVKMAQDPMQAITDLESLHHSFQGSADSIGSVASLSLADVDAAFHHLSRSKSLSSDRVADVKGQLVVALRLDTAPVRHLHPRHATDMVVRWSGTGPFRPLMLVPAPSPAMGGTDEVDVSYGGFGYSNTTDASTAAPVDSNTSSSSQVSTSQPATTQPPIHPPLNPASLSFHQWQEIYFNNNLNRAKVPSLSTGAAPKLAPKPIFTFLKSKTAKPTYQGGLKPTVTQQTFTNEESAYTSASGYESNTTSVKVPFVSHSSTTTTATSSESSSQSNQSKVMTAYNYPAVQVTVSSFLALDPAAESDLMNAVAITSMKERMKALVTFFKTYGYLIPVTVTLGARAYNVQDKSSSSSSSNSSTTTEQSKSTGIGIGGIGASKAKTTGEATTQSLSLSATSANNDWSTIGGDSLKALSLESWSSTVGDWAYWGVITVDELIPVWKSSLVPAEARTAIEEVMNSPTYKVLFGSKDSMTEGDALLGTVQVTSGGLYLSVPHACSPGTVAFFRKGCFATNTIQTQELTITMTGAVNVNTGVSKEYSWCLFPQSNPGQQLVSQEYEKMSSLSMSGVTATWTVDPTAVYVLQEWGKKGSSDVVGESTYTGAQLIDGIGNNQGYGVAATGGGGDIATVNLQVERTSTSETYYNQQLSVANTTLWTVGKYKYGYTLQSVDTPSLYLMADESGTVTVGQMLLSTPGACWLLRSIPSGGWTFLNSMTMQPLMMSANAMYVTQAQRSSLANPTTGTPTSAQAAAQVSGFAAHTVPAKSDTSTTGLTVTTNVAAQSAPAGDPEVVLYCPCCTAGEFASFPLGTGASPVVATTPASEQFSAGQCYVQSVQPSDLVYAMPPTVTPGTIAVGVKSGATPSSNGSLSMACCYTPAAKTTVPPAGVAQPKASGTSPPTSSR